ncbi:MAG: hypothetical protein M3169_18065, partial [Candidatus Eremiobacteraeota bacterium]|nr:hypothetical protein [Candidatus Eremiobacteraeota bacterium]
MRTTVSEADVARLAWLRLSGVGPKTIRGSFAEACTAVDARDILAGYAQEHSEDARLVALDGARRVVEESERAGIAILSCADERYPEPFARIPDPPPYVFVRGALPADWENAVAVIGT